MKTFEYKIFITLFFTIFTAVTGVGIIVPLLPIYAYDLSGSGIDIGLVLGSFSLSRGLFLPYFGQQSDKNGRKPYIILGLICYTLIPIAFIYSNNIKSVILIRSIQGIASAMIMPAVQAYIAEITPPGSEGRIMGVFNMSVFIGLSTGPLLGGIIKDNFGINQALLSMGILSLLGLILSYACLPEKSKEKNKNRNHNKPFLLWRIILNDKVLIGLVSIRLAYTTCIGITWGFLPLLAHNEYKMTSSAIGVLVMLGVGISGMLQIPMGWLSDKIDRKTMIHVGGLIVMISVYSFTLTNEFWTLFYSNILFGIGGSLITPGIMASAIVRGNKNNAMGSVMALMTMGHSIGMLIGSFLAGVMMDFFKLKYVFYLGPPIMLLGMFFFRFFTKNHNLNQLIVRTSPPQNIN